LKENKTIKITLKKMKWLISLVLLAETNAIRLRGIYQQQREKMLEGKASEYFLDIYTEAVLKASLSDKNTNYSFYEYGCIPLGSGMVDNRYIGNNMNVCDVHKENIEYYGMISRRHDVEIDEGVGARYSKMVNKVLTNDEELKHYNIETSEIMQLVIKKINQTFIDIDLTKNRVNCCDQYIMSW
jgi:hypothetical protein